MHMAIRISLTIVQLILAIVGGVLLLLPLSWLFGAMNWPMYHSWGILHGALVSAIPSLAIATYSVLGLIPGFVRPNDIWQRIIGLAVGMAIVSLLVSAKWTSLRYGLFLFAFLSALGLCYAAKTLPLVALTIPLPQLLDDLQFLIPPDEVAWAHIRYGMLRNTLPIIVAAALGCLVSSALQRSRFRWHST